MQRNRRICRNGQAVTYHFKTSLGVENVTVYQFMPMLWISKVTREETRQSTWNTKTISL